MSIFQKSRLELPNEELDTHFQTLKTALQGQEPIANIAHLYGFEDSAQFAKEYTDIDWVRLEFALDHFQTALKNIKKLKAQAAKPLHRPG